jgi:hypothetical protein
MAPWLLFRGFIVSALLAAPTAAGAEFQDDGIVVGIVGQDGLIAAGELSEKERLVPAEPLQDLTPALIEIVS